MNNMSRQELSQRLQTEQTLKFTQELRQSIEILQLSSLDLNTLIARELELNPFLEKEDDETIEQIEEKDETEEEELDLEPDYSDFTANIKNNINNNFDIEDNPNKEKSLKEHITYEMTFYTSSQKQKFIALFLIDMLENNGYITIDYEYIKSNLKCTKEEIDQTLKNLQSIEPAGIFARNLKECLLLQLEDKNLLNEKFKLLVENLELVADGNFKKIQNLCKINEQELSFMMQIIRSLNPKPGNNFASDHTQIIYPDIILKIIGTEFFLEINNNLSPKLKIDDILYQNTTNNTRKKEDKKYIKEQFHNASWLISSIDYRNHTLLKVASSITKIQRDFFLKGINYIVPLKLEEVALACEVNISTVSRIINEKFIDTPTGIFPLKYFFSSSTSDNNSSIKIKHKMKTIIEKEEISNILSDEAIAKILESDNIFISRRTVAKYREELNIESSAIRKKQKALITI